MATVIQIKNLRLEITDPYGVIELITVANLTDLPAAPLPQTAYYVAAIGAFYVTEKESGAVATDYRRVELQLSNDRINNLIDLYGEARAVGAALKAITKRLGARIPLVRQSSGAESFEYQSLSDLYAYYKGLAADADVQVNIDTNNNAGRYFASKNPEIGGRNI
jgi:hypothetical protein